MPVPFASLSEQNGHLDKMGRNAAILLVTYLSALVSSVD
jgi:hypothetical protein